MMTPHICRAHVLFKALQTSKTGFPAVFKGGQKMQAIPMRWKMQDFLESQLCWEPVGPPRLNSAKNKFLLKQALKWPEESSADRFAMTTVYHKSFFFTKAVTWCWAANSVQHPGARTVISACFCLSRSCSDEQPVLQERTRFPSSFTQDY